MIGFVTENLGTLIAGFVLAGIVTAIVASMIRNKRKGKCIGCDGRCGSCLDRRSASLYRAE